MHTRKKIRTRAICVVATVLAMTMLAGCTHMGVEPWQRDVLARPEMRFDADHVSRAFDDHIYFSKEASSGGRGFGGGGCGCN